MLVTSETPTTRMPTQRAAIASMTVDMPTAWAPSAPSMRTSAGVSYVGTQEPRVHALGEGHVLGRGGRPERGPQLGVVHRGQVQEARAHRVVVGAQQRCPAGQVEVVAR